MKEIFNFVLVISIFYLIPVLPTSGIPLEGATFSMKLGDPLAFTGADGRECILSAEIGTGSLSSILNDSGILYRTLPVSTRLIATCNMSRYSIPSNGVPYVDALIKIFYRDDSDQTLCSWYEGCRDSIQLYLKKRIDNKDWYEGMAFGGLNDGLWKSEFLLLGKSPFQLLLTVNSLLSFSIYNYINTPGDIAISELQLSFLSTENFNSVQETIRQQRQLIRKDYLNGTITKLSISSQGPFILFRRNTLQKIYRNTAPTSSEVLSTNQPIVQVIEFQGQIEPSTICVYAQQNITNVFASVTGIPSSIATFTVFEVLIEDRRWAWPDDEYYGSNPWSLRPLVFPLNSTIRNSGNWDRMWNTNTSLTSGTTLQFWINTKVAENAIAGNYSGTISVCANNYLMTRICKTAIIQLSVIGMKLGEPDVLQYLFHSSYYRDVYGSDRRYVTQNQAEHGPISPLIQMKETLADKYGTANFTKMKKEMNEFQSFNILTNMKLTRIECKDYWGDLYYWIYGDYDYFLRTETSEFDQVYKSVLRNYSNFLKNYNVTPSISFGDLPGIRVNSRRFANHLSRLAKEVGFHTWITCDPNCFKAIAGHQFVWENKETEIPSAKRNLPNWIKTDSELRALYDFDNDTAGTYVEDRSIYDNKAYMWGNSRTENGILYVNQTSSSIWINPTANLSFSHAVSIVFSFFLNNYTSDYANFFLMKWNYDSNTDANFVFYLYGDYHGTYNDSLGIFDIATTLNEDYIYLAEDHIKVQLNKWHQIIWSFNSSIGSTIFLDHQCIAANHKPGLLGTNNITIDLGDIDAVFDNFAILGRPLTTNEMASMTTPDTSLLRSITLQTSISVTNVAQIPNLVFFLTNMDEEYENSEAKKFIESKRRIWINNVIAFEEIGQNEVIVKKNVSITSFMTNGINNITFELQNGRKVYEKINLYFADSFWRNQIWTIGGNGNGNGWTYTNLNSDPLGDLAPVGQYIDDMSFSLYWSNEEDKRIANSLGMDFSIFTTYASNIPVPIHNRFIPGIYASSFGVTSVNFYAYSDWNNDIWDDLGPSGGVGEGQQLGASYGLVQVSWDPMLYDSIPWEIAREGIEDSCIINLLKNKIAASSPITTPLAIEANNYLENLLSLSKKDYRGYFERREGVDIERRGDKSDVILQDLSGNANDFDFFDNARQKMIYYIQELIEEQNPKSSSATNPTEISSSMQTLQSIVVIINFESITDVTGLENEIANVLGIDVSQIAVILISSTEVQVIITGQSLTAIQQNVNQLIQQINDGTIHTNILRNAIDAYIRGNAPSPVISISAKHSIFLYFPLHFITFLLFLIH